MDSFDSIPGTKAFLEVPSPRSRREARNDEQKITIKTPVEITSFSFDSNHQYRADDSSLKYYYTPQFDVSLSDGFENFRKLDDNQDGHLDALLRAISDLEKKQGYKIESDIVTWRGMLTKVLTAPYSEDGFEMKATCFQGTIFMEEDHQFKIATHTRQNQRIGGRNQASPELSSFWGYKFEALATLPKPWDDCSRELIENRPRQQVDNHEQYCAVIASRIGDVSFTIGGEVDAVWDAKSTDPSRRTTYVELKTAARPKHDAAARRFEDRLLKFWAQSFLLGVPKIILGLRDTGSEPRLRECEEWATTAIPRFVRERGFATWESAPCIAFAGAFLAFLAKHVRTGGVWRLSLAGGSGPGKRVEIVKELAEGVDRIVSDDFVAWRMELAARSSGASADGRGERSETPPSC